ncbi:MAG: hypothetical protein ACI9EB_000566 [Pseudomonas sp.]|jgi:hypothetical protein
MSVVMMGVRPRFMGVINRGLSPIAPAKVGGGSNVRCNDLLGVNCTKLNRQVPGMQPAPELHCDEGTKA